MPNLKNVRNPKNASESPSTMRSAQWAPHKVGSTTTTTTTTTTNYYYYYFFFVETVRRAHAM